MTKTCLIVDDSKVVRSVARRIISDLDFECVEAEDGQIALEVCKKDLPDSILLEWNMPNMMGIDFLKALRQLPGGDNPIVIFCTTENEFSFIEKALGAGADEYIMKPFDMDIIEGKFKQLGLI